MGNQEKGFVFAHDWRDAFLLIISLLELSGKVALVIFWDALQLPFPLLCMAALCLLNCSNYQCAAHYFVHLPFFSRQSLNRLWGIVGSMGLGVPMVFYGAHHLNHHRFGSDYIDRDIGDTHDRSSIYRHGRAPNEPEDLWRYALFGPFRASLVLAVADVRCRGETVQFVAELASIGLLLLALSIRNLRGLVLIYLPIWYLGLVLAYAENYLEHFGARPGDRRTDAVSCYGRLYNLVWFNNGYHQEHHFRPGTHWSRLPELRNQMLPESKRRVVSIAHFMNCKLRTAPTR